MKKNAYTIPNVKKDDIVSQQLSGKLKSNEGPKRNIDSPAKMGHITNKIFLDIYPKKRSKITQQPKYAAEFTTNT